MDNEEPYFLHRFFKCDNKIKSSLVHDSETNNQCKCNQQSFFTSLINKFMKIDEKKSDSLKSEKNNKNSSDKVRKAKEDNFRKSTIVPSCPYRSNKKNPIEVQEYLCFIKEQNPLSPCCCKQKTDDDEDETPCPPSGSYQEPRSSTCECDLCRKSGYHCQCCNRETYIRGVAETPPKFESA